MDMAFELPNEANPTGVSTNVPHAAEPEQQAPQQQQQPQVELTALNLIMPTHLWRQIRGQPNWKTLIINTLIDNMSIIQARTEDMSN